MSKDLIYLFFPLNLCLLFLTLGILLIWFKKAIGRFLAAFGLFLLFVLSTQGFSTFALGHLERQHLPFKDIHSLPISQIRHIVVLGGLSFQDSNLPLTSQINAPMLIRLIEGIRLHRLLPETQLVLSGGGKQPKSEAQMMARLAVELGINPDTLILENQSQSTFEEAHLLKDILGNRPFILVTSARHMPRSVRLFRKLGLNPIPAPTNHLLRAESTHFYNGFIPNADYLLFTSAACYEYLGLLKEWAKGRI